MKLTKTSSGKYKITKEAWEEIGKKAGWMKKASKVYRDNDRTLEISGHSIRDDNLNYTATIRDEYGSVESVLSYATLSEIYKWAKEHNFYIKEEQTKTAQYTTPWKREEYPKAFKYFINLDERGEFYADVRNPQGDTVFEIKGFDIFEDGFMNDKADMGGLKEYLVSLGIMTDDQQLFKMDPSLERIAQFTPKMMPGQEPYTEEEYKKVTDMIGDASLGDPGEEGEEVFLREDAEDVLGSDVEEFEDDVTIDGVPFNTLEGVKIVNIISLLSKIGGDMLTYEENSARVMKWAKEHNADYYAQTREKFNIIDAIDQAKANGKDIVIVEDLS